MTPRLIDRLGKLIPRLSSPMDGEVLATVGAIRAALGREGLDLHDLSNRLCCSRPASTFAADAGFDDWVAADTRRREREREIVAWAADLLRRYAEREREWNAADKRREAEREAAEAAAAENAAKAAARAAARATPEFKARVERHRRAALAKRAAEAERVEAERVEAERIATEGPRWGELGDAPRRAWIYKIMRDPLANLDPSTTAALNGIEAALAPLCGRRHKPKITPREITPEWIAEFERAARDHAMRHAREVRP